MWWCCGWIAYEFVVDDVGCVVGDVVFGAGGNVAVVVAAVAVAVVVFVGVAIVVVVVVVAVAVLLRLVWWLLLLWLVLWCGGCCGCCWLCYGCWCW